MNVTELYRYRAIPDDDYIDLTIVLDKFPVIKTTPGGWWIDIHTVRFIKGKPNIKSTRWISKDAARTFAYATEKEAMLNFAHRKFKQIRILKNQLAQAKAERNKIEEMLEKAGHDLPYRIRH